MKKIAIYLRLSLADADLGIDGKEESNSIENQRLLIRNYLESHEELVGEVVEYKDDGYSGLDFNRPAFRLMIEDAKRGIVGTIIVKDISRFGRDYLGMGDYMEQILPSLGVRLIAITSKYDSADQGANAFSIDVSIGNMINNMYSRDLSKKLRSSFRTKWNAGLNPSGNAPFGYVVNSNDEKHCFIIDEEAAQIVRLIFSLAIEGKPSKDIAEYLNEQGMPTPTIYSNQKYGTKIPKTIHNIEEQLWNTHKVLAVLKKREYTGVRVHGQYEGIGIGDKKRKKCKEQDWIITENSHPPIVSREDFLCAQDIIQRKRPPQGWNKSDDPFGGKFRCACCGNILQTYHPDDKVLYCQHAVDIGSKSKCNRDTFDKGKLQTVTLYALQRHITELDSLGKRLREKNSEKFFLTDKSADSYREELKKLSDDLAREYESYVNGHLPRERFAAIKKKIGKRKKELEELLTTIEQEKTDSEIMNSDIHRVVTQGKKLQKSEKFTASVIDALIECIYVYNQDKIEIKFRFEDLYERTLAVEGYDN